MDHKILVDKLFNIFNWFKSYSSNRKQYLNLQVSNSEIETVSCGVPQSSVPGPPLFILYVNYLSKVSNKCVPILDADDTTILFEGHTIHSIGTSLNYELGKLIILLNANKLSITVYKTYTLHGGSPCKTSISQRHHLEQLHFTTFVGIIIDEKLKMGQSYTLYIYIYNSQRYGHFIKGQKGVKNKSFTTVIPFLRISISNKLFRSIG